jgi:hypothetical protein
MKTASTTLSRFALALATSGAVLASIATPARLTAQNPNAGQMAEAYAQNAQANGKLMHQYTWQMRVSLTYKGTAEAPQLYQMNWAPDGTLQKTLISAPPEEKKEHGVRKHVEESDIASLKAYLDSLVDLTKRYTTPSPGTMMNFYSAAVMTPAPGGGVAATESGFLQPGDKATFTLDSSTHQPTSFAFSTTLEGDAVSGSVIYGSVPGGPNYASQTSVSVPSKQIALVLENFNYVKQ